MFPGYGGSAEGSSNGRGPSRDLYSSFPNYPQKQSKGKTQFDYDEENRIKLKRQRDNQRKAFEAHMQEYKEQNAYKAIKDCDSDDSDGDVMEPSAVEAICKTNGGSHEISDRSRRMMGRAPSPKRERKEKKRRRKSSSTSSSSSSDSSRDRRRRRRRSRSRSRKRYRSRSRSPKRRNRSNERKSKHKKKKKRRRSSSSSESSSSDVQVVEDRTPMSSNQRLFKKPKYKPIRESEASSLPLPEIYVYDYHLENENFTYDGVQPGQRSEVVPETFCMPYIVTNFRKDLGKDDRAVPKETYDKKKKKRELRFHQAVPNLKKTENEFRSLPWEDGDGVVFISQTDGKFRFLHEIEDEKREEERRQTAMDEIRREERVPFDEDKALMEARLKIRENPRDPKSYLDFLGVQDSVYERDLRVGTLSGNITVRNERKLAILDQGIKQCPRDVALRVERAKILGEMDPDKAHKEWEQLTHKFVNNLSMWDAYLDTLLNDGRMFDMQTIDQTFDRCHRNLFGLMTGEIKSHKVDDDTKKFLLKLFIRQLKFYISTGYVERAIASIQASIEFSFFQPIELRAKRRAEKLEAFKEFWMSGVPRIGDKGAEGWDKYERGRYSEAEIRNMETVELELENGRYAKLKQRVGEKQGMGRYQKYVFLEKAAQRIFCRPQRHETNFMDNEHNVDNFRHPNFYAVLIRELGRDDVFEVLSTFGMQIIGYETSNPTLWEMAEQFGISEQQPILPPPAHKILCRITRTLALRDGSVQLMFSLIHSYLPVLKASNISKETAMMRFLSFVTRMKQRPDGNAPVQKKRKKKKGNYESSDEEDDEEPFPCMQGRPLSSIYWSLLDCYAINAALTSKLLRRNDSINKAIQMVDEMVARTCARRQQGEGTTNQRLQIEYQMVLTLILFVVQNSMDCKPDERPSLHHTFNEKLVEWICRLLQPKEEQTTALRAHMYLDALRKPKVEFLTEEEGQLASIMADCNSLALCLKMWMAALRGGAYRSEYNRHCYDMWTQYSQAPESRYQSLVHSTLLAILHREWTWFHRNKQQLNDELMVHLNHFPMSTEPIKIAIDMISKSGGVVQYSRRLDQILGDYGGAEKKVRRALAHVAVMDRKMKHVEEEIQKEDNGRDALEKISGMLSDVLSREAESLCDPFVWRMALKKTNSPIAAQQLYIKAIAKCRWDRQLHLDIMERCDETLAGQSYELIDESYLRHLTNIEDVDIYTEMVEAQKAAAAADKST